jgi:hypothetical protein
MSALASASAAALSAASLAASCAGVSGGAGSASASAAAFASAAHLADITPSILSSSLGSLNTPVRNSHASSAVQSSLNLADLVARATARRSSGFTRRFIWMAALPDALRALPPAMATRAI